MKLGKERVEGFIGRPDPKIAVALFHGPDSGLVAERARRMAATVVDDLNDPFRVAELEPERLKSEPQLLVEEAQSLSMLGGRRLVRVRRAADLISPAVRLLLSGGAPEAFVLLEGGDLPGSSSLRKLVEGSPMAAALPCYRDEGGELKAVIRGLLAEEGLTAEADTLEHLASCLGGDRAMTRQEIAKLALFVGTREDRTVRLADIADVVDDSSALALDDLQRAALVGGRELEPLLDRLLAEGVRPEAMMRATSNLVTILLRCAMAVDAGASTNAAISGARPPFYGRRRDIAEQVLRRWRSPDLAAALGRLRAAEASSRTRRAPSALICRHVLGSLADLVRSSAR